MIVERERILIAKHSEVASLTRQGRLLWRARLSEKYKQAGTAMGIPGHVRQADLVKSGALCRPTRITD